MYVAVDTNSILPGRVGGIESYTIGLIEALQRPDSPAERLLVLTRAENHTLFLRFASDITRVHCIERPNHRGKPVDNWAALSSKDPITAERLLKQFQNAKGELLASERVDLLHFPGNTINPLELEIPIVLNLHDLQHRHFPQYFTADELAEREKWWVASAHRADAMIAGSDWIKSDLQKQLGVSAEKVFVTPEIMQARYLERPSEQLLAEARTRLKLPERFFIYPAAVWPHKNHERLIRAFAELNECDVHLILTGGGQADSHLPALIQSLGMTNRIRLLGRVDDATLVALYHLATALVMPSEHEAWSLPVMEAMACGCPVASSNVTSLPEEVGDAGLLFEPGDVGAMRDAMQRLLRDAVLRERLARLGRERVRQFSPARFNQTLTRAYHYALNPRVP